MNREDAFKIIIIVTLISTAITLLVGLFYILNVLQYVVAGIWLIILPTELLYRVSSRRQKVMNTFGANYYLNKTRNRRFVQKQWILNLINKIRK